MVALIVGVSIVAILMTAVMPVWSQIARREREAELIFRGEQYARAIGLFQRRAGPGVLPPSVDVLVEQKFLRGKYKDPITNDDFALLSALTPTAGPAGGTGRGNVPSQGTVGTVTPQSGGRGVPGGLMGVTSKSTEESLRTYKGRTHYNEWQFVFLTQSPAVQGPNGSPSQIPQRGGPPLPIGPGSMGPRVPGVPAGPGGTSGGPRQPAGRAGAPPPGGGFNTQRPGGGPQPGR